MLVRKPSAGLPHSAISSSGRLSDDGLTGKEDLPDHLLLRREVVVQAAGEDSGLLGDVADRGRGDPLGGEDACGDSEQLLAT